MKYSKTCEHCGHTETAYTHSLNKSLLEAFKRLCAYWEVKKMPCNINKELQLTHNQIANFQKLRHFGIAQNIEDAKWIPTDLGMGFYHGEVSIWNPAASMGNTSLSADHPAWKTHKTPRKHITCPAPLVGINYKQREHYRDERRTQQSLF